MKLKKYINFLDSEKPSDFSTIPTTHEENQKTTPVIKPSSHHSSEESKTELTQPITGSSRGTPTHTDKDNNSFDIEDVSKTPLTHTNSDVKITSEGPSTLTQTQSQTLNKESNPNTDDQNRKVSYDIDRPKNNFKTTDEQFNLTQSKISSDVPTVSATKVSPSFLLSSVFEKQKDAGSQTNTEAESSSSSSTIAVSTSEQPTIINVKNGTDEIDFQTEEDSTKKGNEQIFLKPFLRKLWANSTTTTL